MATTTPYLSLAKAETGTLQGTTRVAVPFPQSRPRSAYFDGRPVSSMHRVFHTTVTPQMEGADSQQETLLQLHQPTPTPLAALHGLHPVRCRNAPKIQLIQIRVMIPQQGVPCTSSTRQTRYVWRSFRVMPFYHPIGPFTPFLVGPAPSELAIARPLTGAAAVRVTQTVANDESILGYD